MAVPFRVVVLQLSMEPLEQTVSMAQACDRAGFDIFWLAEAYPWWRKHGFEARSSTAITAVIATQSLRATPLPRHIGRHCPSDRAHHQRLGHHLALHPPPRADRHGSARDAGCRG